MAVTFAADGASATITLDNPPANSYDIEFMRELGRAVDAADRGRAARGRRPQREREVLLRRRRRQAVPRQRRRGQHGDDPRSLTRRWPASRARRSCSSPASPVTRSAAGSRSRWRATSVYAVRGRLPLGTPEVTLGLLPGQRRHAAAAAADRRRPGARAAPHRPTGHARGGAATRPGLAVCSTARSSSDAQVRETRRACRRWRRPRSSAPSTKACDEPLDGGLELERELIEKLFRSQGRGRGPERVRREAHAGVRGRMSTETLTTYRRRVHRRCPAREHGRPAAGHQPRRWAGVRGASPAGPPGGCRCRRPGGRRRVRRVVGAGRLEARRDPRPGGPPRRGAPRRADPAAHPRAGQDAARLADRADQGASTR